MMGWEEFREAVERCAGLGALIGAVEMNVAIIIASYISAGVLSCAFIRVGRYFLFRREWEMDEFCYRCEEDASFVTVLMVVFWPLCDAFWLVMFLGKVFFLVSRAASDCIVRLLERED